MENKEFQDTTEDVELFEEVAGHVESYYDLDDDDDGKVFSVKNVILTVLISIVALILVFTIMGAVEMACYKTTGVIDNDYITKYEGVEDVKSYVTKITNLLNNDLKTRGLTEEDAAGNDVTDAIVNEWYQEWTAVASEARSGYNGELNRALVESDGSDDYATFYNDYVAFLEKLRLFSNKLAGTFSGNSVTEAYSNTVTNYKVYHFEYPSKAERKMTDGVDIKGYNDAKDGVIKALERVLAHFEKNAIYKQI